MHMRLFCNIVSKAVGRVKSSHRIADIKLLRRDCATMNHSWANQKIYSHMRLFSNIANKAADRAKVLQLIVDIKLLQRTCELMNHPGVKPSKYSHMTLEQAHNEQRRLLPQMKTLMAKFSYEEGLSILDEASMQAGAIADATRGLGA